MTGSFEKAKHPDEDEFVLRRTIEITEALYARYGRDTPNVTMAVAVAQDPRGCGRKLISSNEGDYVRPDVLQLARPRPDEIIVPGMHHAEQNIVSFVKSNDWRLRSIGATRPICPACQIAIGWCRVRPITRVK